MENSHSTVQSVGENEQDYLSEVQRLNALYASKNGRCKKCFIDTYGCQMNEHDSEILLGLLVQMGYEKTDDLSKADLILLNTCCIREKAESKVLSHLGELRRLKNDNPELIIGVCGCMMQQDGMIEKIETSAPHVQLLFGTHNLHKLPEFIYRLMTNSEKQMEILPKETAIQEGLPTKREFPFKALVNIIYGCNNFCTYCIVPYVRGRERSRQINDIVEEVKNLVADGVVEITLLGQNVNSYGKDLKDGTNFALLLTKLCEIDGLKRIRYMTSHPKDLTEELIQTVARHPKICSHFHLPVQSGSSAILKAMNRGYTKEDYLLLVEKIRHYLPKAAITTDIIVGFPNETEEDFLETIDLVQKVQFDNAFSFIYSKRAGTPAARMQDDVSLEEKKERLQRLNDVLGDYAKAINETYVHQVIEILVEGVSKNNANMLSGKTASNKTVIFAGDVALVGQFVLVEITEAQTWILKGVLLEQ